MAASKGPEAVVELQGEAARQDTIRGLESRCVGEVVVSVEEPEEGRCQAQYLTILKITQDPTVDNARGFYPSLITVIVFV
jgi:hypothetical protein